jgi:hypothetical protein
MQAFVEFSESLVSKGPLFERGDLSIYALLDPEDNTVRYVGITISPSSRLKHHRNNQSKNRELRHWLSTLPDGPKLMVLATVSREVWARAERSWIAYVRSQGAIYNIHDGGSSTAFWASRPKNKRPKKHRRGKKKKRSRHPKGRGHVKRVKDAFGLWLPVAKA